MSDPEFINVPRSQYNALQRQVAFMAGRLASIEAAPGLQPGSTEGADDVQLPDDMPSHVTLLSDTTQLAQLHTHELLDTLERDSKLAAAISTLTTPYAQAFASEVEIRGETARKLPSYPAEQKGEAWDRYTSHHSRSVQWTTHMPDNRTSSFAVRYIPQATGWRKNKPLRLLAASTCIAAEREYDPCDKSRYVQLRYYVDVSFGVNNEMTSIATTKQKEFAEASQGIITSKYSAERDFIGLAQSPHIIFMTGLRGNEVGDSRWQLTKSQEYYRYNARNGLFVPDDDSRPRSPSEFLALTYRALKQIPA